MAFLNFRTRHHEDSEDESRDMADGSSGLGSERPEQWWRTLHEPSVAAQNADHVPAGHVAAPFEDDPARRQLSINSPGEAFMDSSSNDRLPPTYPFADADIGIEPVDKTHNGQNGNKSPVESNTMVDPEDLAGTAHELADSVEELVRRLRGAEARVRELEQERAAFESRLRAQQEKSTGYESVKVALQEAAGTSLTDEDLESLQRVLYGLTQDPNHIMVLASVAQQAHKLMTAVSAFSRVQHALQQLPK